MKDEQGGVPGAADGEIVLDLREIYRESSDDGVEAAKLDRLGEYLARARELAGEGNRVVLTGAAPVWLYLKVAHELHGLARTLYYESPVSGRVLVFDHDPF